MRVNLDRQEHFLFFDFLKALVEEIDVIVLLFALYNNLLNSNSNTKHTFLMQLPLGSSESKTNVQTDFHNVPIVTNSGAAKTSKKERMTPRKRFPKVELYCRTPYQFYVKEKAKENRDGKRPSKSAVEYSNQWKLETDRSRWVKMAANDKIRFIEEVRCHGYTYDRVNKDLKCKKPCAPFLLYARDNAPKLRKDQGVTYREALMILGAKWKENAEPEIKAQYIEIVRKENK